MASKKSSKPNPFSFPLIILSIFLLLLTLNCLRRIQTRSPEKALLRVARNNPEWYNIIAKKITNKRLKIGLVNIEGNFGLDEAKDVMIMDINFSRVGNNIKWSDLFPGWIDENVPWMSQGCPKIPMPNFEEDDHHYQDLDVVVAKIDDDQCGEKPKGKGLRDVFRLQVNLVVANLLVRSGLKKVVNGVDDDDDHRPVYAVFMGSCSPMWEIFRCDDLVWHEGDVWIYRPDLRRLNEKVFMPVGTCQLARPFAESGEEGWNRNPLSNTKNHHQREAYVSVLHSSEAYVCGAIALAQTIIQSNSTKDLVLLADDSISAKSLHGLKSAGWKINRIERIRSPQATKNAYNEWNYSKLQLWQLTEYDKVLFIDADLILLRNIDEFFNYPQLSAAWNNKYLFNSGVMLIEPSKCTFETLMKERFTTDSYNGGDQGFLNEMFPWWHRWPTKLNHLKFFGSAASSHDQEHEHEILENVYALHYLGLKPWMCYQDYDCNWDRLDYHRFASDLAHEKWWNVYKAMPEKLRSYCGLTPLMEARIRKWRGRAKIDRLPDGHWKIKVKDTRRLSI